MPNLYDLVDAKELRAAVNDLRYPNHPLLDTVLPRQDIGDIQYRFNTGTIADVDAAVYRAFDTEAPIGKRQGIATKSGELPPISKKIPLGEEEYLRRQMDLTGNIDPFVDRIYQDAFWLRRAIDNRLELAVGEAIYNGKVTISENGVGATIDFGRDAGHNPTALTSTAVWSDLDDSTPIEDLTGWVQTYETTNFGRRPAYILTSRAVVANLLKNESIRTYLASRLGTPEQVTRDQLGQVLDAWDLPPIRVYDNTYPLAGSATRPIPANRVTLMPEDGALGNTLFGETREAQRQVSNGLISREEAPGYATDLWETEDPVTSWTKVAAIAVPIVREPNLTFSVAVQA